MADRKGKGILFEDDDDPIDIPEQDTSHLIQGYGLSLIGKVLNPKKQDVEKLIAYMPQQWGLEGKISANDLGNGKFLFNFESEEDLQSVLEKGPFHYNFWMIVLVRWEPIVHDEYPWELTLWTQLTGLPLHFWLEATMRSIGEKVGHVLEVDEDDAWLCLTVDSRKPLKFTCKIRFHTGEQATVQLKYDRLFKFCSHCGSLSHEVQVCPMRTTAESQTRPGIFTRIQPRTSISTSPNKRPQPQPIHMTRSMNRELATKTTKRTDQKAAPPPPERDRRHNPAGGQERQPRDDRTSSHRQKELRRQEYHPYHRRDHEVHRSTWIRKEHHKEKISQHKRKGNYHGDNGVRKKLIHNPDVVDSHLSKISLGDTSHNHEQRKDPPTEEVQSNHRSTPKTKGSSDVDPTPLTDISYHRSDMEEDIIIKDQSMTNAAHVNQMIDALCQHEAGEIGDNDDLLGDDLAQFEADQKYGHKSASTSHEDSLNVTITAFKAKVKSKSAKIPPVHPLARPPNTTAKAPKRSFTHGILSKKAELLRKGSPRKRVERTTTVSSFPGQPDKTLLTSNKDPTIATLGSADDLIGSAVFQKPPSPSI